MPGEGFGKRVGHRLAKLVVRPLLIVLVTDPSQDVYLQQIFTWTFGTATALSVSSVIVADDGDKEHPLTTTNDPFAWRKKKKGEKFFQGEVKKKIPLASSYRSWCSEKSLLLTREKPEESFPVSNGIALRVSSATQFHERAALGRCSREGGRVFFFLGRN